MKFATVEKKHSIQNERQTKMWEDAFNIYYRKNEYS